MLHYQMWDDEQHMVSCSALLRANTP